MHAFPEPLEDEPDETFVGGRRKRSRSKRSRKTIRKNRKSRRSRRR